MSRRTRRAFVARALLAFALGVTSASRAVEPSMDAAPYAATPDRIVDEILALAEVGAGDFVVDLGSGDGRLVIAAAKQRGARGFGVDIDPKLVDLANRRAADAGVAGRARFVERDLFATDVHEATVVTVYLMQKAMPRVEAKLLAELAPGTRVVAHDFGFPHWPVERTRVFDVPEKNDYTWNRQSTLYLYTVPARVAGDWSLALPGRASPVALRIGDGLRAAGVTLVGAQPGESGRVQVNGARVRLELPPAAGDWPALDGTMRDGAIEGTLPDGRRWRAVRAS